MTKSATVTEAQIARAIRAAQRTGHRVKAIHPVDGTIIVEAVDDKVTIIGPEPGQQTDPWED